LARPNQPVQMTSGRHQGSLGSILEIFAAPIRQIFAGIDAPAIGAPIIRVFTQPGSSRATNSCNRRGGTCSDSRRERGVAAIDGRARPLRRRVLPRNRPPRRAAVISEKRTKHKAQKEPISHVCCGGSILRKQPIRSLTKAAATAVLVFGPFPYGPDRDRLSHNEARRMRAAILQGRFL